MILVLIHDTYGRDLHTALWWGNLKERSHLEDTTINARIILKCILKIGYGNFNWIHLAQESRDKWQALVKTNETLGSINLGEFLD